MNLHQMKWLENNSEITVQYHENFIDFTSCDLRNYFLFFIFFVIFEFPRFKKSLLFHCKNLMF